MLTKLNKGGRPKSRIPQEERAEEEDDESVNGLLYPKSTGDPILDFERYEREPVLFTTRIPLELFYELKKRALRSTMQILAEHAYTLYLGGRLPPDLWGGAGWPEEFPAEPKPAYLSGRLRGFSVRLPRMFRRRIRRWAVDAEISDQELATRVFDWYVRKNYLPPYRNAVKRGSWGRLLVDEPMIADEFTWYSDEQLAKAFEILVERHTEFGGPLGRGPGTEGARRGAGLKVEHNSTQGRIQRTIRKERR